MEWHNPWELHLLVHNHMAMAFWVRNFEVVGGILAIKIVYKYVHQYVYKYVYQGPMARRSTILANEQGTCRSRSSEWSCSNLESVRAGKIAGRQVMFLRT